MVMLNAYRAWGTVLGQMGPSQIGSHQDALLPDHHAVSRRKSLTSESRDSRFIALPSVDVKAGDDVVCIPDLKFEAQCTDLTWKFGLTHDVSNLNIDPLIYSC